MYYKNYRLTLAAALFITMGLFGIPSLSQADTAMTNGRPLVFTVNGRQFPIAVVRIRNKHEIVLSTKEELGKFPDLNLSINISGVKLGELSNQHLHFTGKDFSEPILSLSWKEPGKSLPTSVFITKNYDLWLAFGQEKDFRIPLEFKLNTNQGVTMSAAGTHLAKTSDLVVIDGKVDIHQDNADTILYVAERFIQRVDKLPALPTLKQNGMGISMPGANEKPDPNPKRVYSSAEFAFEYAAPSGKETGKIQMVRDRNGWQVYRVLSPERLRGAKQVDLSLDALFVFKYFGEQAVAQIFGKNRVQAWDEKRAMLQFRDPDPKKNQDQIGNATYLVTLKDGSQRYVKVLAKKPGVWKISKVLDGSQVERAHADKPINQKAWSTELQQYLSAVRLEKALNKRYLHPQIGSTNFSCGISKLLTACKVSWYRLVNNKEVCEGTKYMYRRKDINAPWQYVRELAADEELDHRDGQVKKQAKPTKYFCW